MLRYPLWIKGIVYASIYPTKKLPTYKTFFREMMKKHWRQSRGGCCGMQLCWYKIVERLGIKRSVVSGDNRNYIERWFQTLKRRINQFYCYFPESKNVEHANRWLKMFVFCHNNMRKHQGLGWKKQKEVLN
ncbi:hypothetical protein C9439_05745 [archaeon SCG-AAA382B04]|nr:hypothetical protein C9439_05745 [archaeon SCG-AAA382B04]